MSICLRLYQQTEMTTTTPQQQCSYAPTRARERERNDCDATPAWRSYALTLTLSERLSKDGKIIKAERALLLLLLFLFICFPHVLGMYNVIT